MALYQEYLTNEATGETVLLGGDSAAELAQEKQKQLERWKGVIHAHTIQGELDQKTTAAEEWIEAHKNILRDALGVDMSIAWDRLREDESFKDVVVPTKPNWDDYAVRMPTRGFLSDLLFSSSNTEKEKRVKEGYELDMKQYEQDLTSAKQAVQDVIDGYESNIGEGVAEYLQTALERSVYPGEIQLKPDVQFEPMAGVTVIDISAPLPDQTPSVVSYKHEKKRNLIVPKEMKQKARDELYNDILYMIVLRTVYEVISADYKNGVQLVVVNAWVDTVDKKTGHPMRNCIASLQTSAEAFGELNLSNIDPQECFRHLKGVTAGSLAELSPVKPIMKINKEDGRIIKADRVIDDMENRSNLATMDWKKFEILVRDLISKEFSTDGCSVEVTRASRDAGVDALAFDEDPIRGGKYVIQAKRYNKLVPLTSVRDLYGTVHNEGAVKGILITTSYFGKDAMEFVKDKPLKLINGEELLYMFNKHGYDFRIELTSKKGAKKKIATAA